MKFPSFVDVVASGLKLVKVTVPHYRFPGEMAILQCDYDLEGDTLYSVKWYKDHEEFYRYVPKDKPQANSYRVDGINVEVSISVKGCIWTKGAVFNCVHS